MSERPDITHQFAALVKGAEARGSTIAILLCLVVLGVWGVLGYLQWINDDDPDGVLPEQEAARLAREAEPVVTAPAERPRRVVVILIDGLRADFSRQMGALSQLAAQGAEMEVDVGLPSMSRPVYAAMGSGTTQERNGVRTNAFHGQATVDNVFARARAAGLRVACVSNLGWWQELFPRGFDRHVVTTFRSFEEAALLALEGDFDLVLLHTTEVDYAGHQHGGRSLDYARAVQSSEHLLEDLLAGPLDLERDAVFVVSDHGHRNRGGHGGDEPHVRRVRWVAAGVGIRPGATASLVASQLGPTLSVLLGVPYPRDAWSPPAFGILDPERLGATYLDGRRAGFEAQVSGYLEALATEGTVQFAPGEGIDAWRSAMADVRLEGRAIRLGLASVVAILGLWLIVHERREAAGRVLVAGLVFVAVYVLAGWITGSVSSLSAAEREYRYLLRLMALGLMAFLGQHLVMHWLNVKDWGSAYLIGSWVPAMSALVVYAWYGFPLTPPMPSPMLTFFPVFVTLMMFSQAAMGGLSLALLWIVELRAARRARRMRRRSRLHAE